MKGEWIHARGLRTVSVTFGDARRARWTARAVFSVDERLSAGPELRREECHGRRRIDAAPSVETLVSRWFLVAACGRGRVARLARSVTVDPLARERVRSGRVPPRAVVRRTLDVSLETIVVSEWHKSVPNTLPTVSMNHGTVDSHLWVRDLVSVQLRSVELIRSLDFQSGDRSQMIGGRPAVPCL